MTKIYSPELESRITIVYYSDLCRYICHKTGCMRDAISSYTHAAHRGYYTLAFLVLSCCGLLTFILRTPAWAEQYNILTESFEEY